MEVKMNDLPILPFEKILSYLSLEDRIRSRAVSRSWRMMFDFKVKSLFYSSRPSGFVYRKARLVVGEFARNFFSSPRFASFFDTFGQSILSSLKHLRLYEIKLDQENGPALVHSLNSFGQLEELALFGFDHVGNRFSKLRNDLNLSLPMLNSIHLERVRGIEKLTLNAPRLRTVRVQSPFFPGLHLVHGESVERLFIGDFQLRQAGAKKLKNLKYLYIGTSSSIDSALLSSLEQLKELHLYNHLYRHELTNLFRQKQRSSRSDLKIFYLGVLMNGPHDRPKYFDIFHLPEDSSRLADEIPFYDSFPYTEIEQLPSAASINFWNRFTNLSCINLLDPVQSVEHFLGHLENISNISKLIFCRDQSQDLFDRLPEHSTLQMLTIFRAPSDFGFLLRLTHLIELRLHFEIDAVVVRNLLEGLRFLLTFEFSYLQKTVLCVVRVDHSKRFKVSFDGKKKTAPDVKSLIRLIFGKEAAKLFDKSG